MTELRYTKEHEWARSEGDAVICGISNYAQKAMGDVVYVELPAIGRKVQKGEQIAVVESAKAASEVYAPVAGEIIAVNEALTADPGNVNAAAQTEGWLFKIKGGMEGDLMDEATYQNYVKGLAA